MARKFSHSYEVCTCKQVTLGEIVHAIKERGASNIKEIGELTDAGTCCKSCVCKIEDHGVKKMELYLDEILNKIAKK